ncbi:EAL domain-containing protein [Methylobacillus gramineus]|uniref:EAL domain-containing protein n=1 Tax=Methylobacillus gramineus TaxID=755169 RepID=UPI001D0014B6|nr:EAL domain-containing protein [Methylobacillus gramineus]MCB5185087.1 EAL domain-containing protein [Methylobacillus gramineus]
MSKTHENQSTPAQATKISSAHIEQLKIQLRESLYLDLDEYGLEEQQSGEFNSTFLGIQLNSAFQPIYDSEAGDLHGHEAFLRPSLGGLQAISPEFAFSFAEQGGKLVKFDRVARTLHVLNFRQIYAENGLLFLNVHPNLLISVNAHGKVFERILHSNSVPTDRVVIEIQESVLEHENQLAEAIENYRERGYGIAIDNFGNKHSHLERLWKLSPEFVKFDTSLIKEAERNPRLRKILPGLIQLARDIGAQPVITGIESQTGLEIAIESGSTLLQGYFLGKPVTARELQPTDAIKPALHLKKRAAA